MTERVETRIEHAVVTYISYMACSSRQTPVQITGDKHTACGPGDEYERCAHGGCRCVVDRRSPSGSCAMAQPSDAEYFPHVQRSTESRGAGPTRRGRSS